MPLPERADPYLEPPKPSKEDRGGVNFAPEKWLGAAKGIYAGLADLLLSDDMEPGEGFLDRFKKEGERRAKLVDDPNTTFLGRAAKGAEDLVLGAANLASAVVPFTERRPGETEEESEARAERDTKEMGREAIKGMVVAPGTTIQALNPFSDVPVKSLAADPVGTALDLFPAAKLAKVGAAKGAAKLSSITREYSPAGRAAAVVDAVDDMPAPVPDVPAPKPSAKQRVKTAVDRAADNYRAQMIDNLAGTEVKDLPQFIRGIDRMGDVLADEAADLRARVKASPNPDAEGMIAYGDTSGTARVTTGGGRRTEARFTRAGAGLPEEMSAIFGEPEGTPYARADDLAEPSPGSLIEPKDRTRLQSLAGRAAIDSPALRALDESVVSAAERKVLRDATAGERGDFREALLRAAMDPRADLIEVDSRPTTVISPEGAPTEVSGSYFDFTDDMPADRPLDSRVYRDAVLLDQLHKESGVPWPTDEAAAKRAGSGDMDLLRPAPIPAGAGAFDEGRPLRMILREHMSPYRAKLQAALDEGGPRAEAAKAELEHIRGWEEMTYRGQRLYVPPRVKVALEVEEAVRRPQEGLIDAINGSLKSGLTSRSFKSGINNLMGNAILQSVRRAGSRGFLPPRPTALPHNTVRQLAARSLPMLGGPVGTELAQWVTSALERDWARRNTSNMPNDYTVRKWRALAKEKIAGTTQQQVELQGGLTEMPGTPGIIKGMAKVNAPLEWFYRNGDVWAKGAEAGRAFDEVVRLLDRQPEGKSTKFRGRDGAVVEVLRSGPDTFDVKVGPRRTVVREGSTQYDRLVGSIAAEQADRIFFDYNRTSRMAKQLRRSKAGIASPFYSWMSLAMDLPGRKGLLSHAISGPDFVLDRNWYSMADAAADAAKQTVRSAVHGLMVHQIQNSSEEELLQMLEQFPRQYRMMLAGEMTNPSYTEVEDLGNWNSFSPTSLMLSGLDALQVYGTTPAEQAEMIRSNEPRARQIAKLLRRQQTGRGFTPSDMADLAGLAGGLSMDVINLIDRSSKPGADDKPIEKLMETLARGLAGGSLVDAALIGASGVQELTGSPDRFGSMRKMPTAGQERVEKGFLQWAIRKFTGVGWDAIISDPKNIDKNLDKVRSAWKNGMNLKERVDEAKRAGSAPGASEELKDEMRARIRVLGNMDKLIDAEINEMRSDAISALSKVMGAGQKQRSR